MYWNFSKEEGDSFQMMLMLVLKEFQLDVKQCTTEKLCIALRKKCLRSSCSSILFLLQNKINENNPFGLVAVSRDFPFLFSISIFKGSSSVWCFRADFAWVTGINCLFLLFAHRANGELAVLVSPHPQWNIMHHLDDSKTQECLILS